MLEAESRRLFGRRLCALISVIGFTRSNPKSCHLKTARERHTALRCYEKPEAGIQSSSP